MNPLLLILGGVGLWILLKKKDESPELPATSQTNVTTLPEVVITPGPSVSPSGSQPIAHSQASNNSPLTAFENDILNGGTPTNVYNAGMSSSNRAFVTQAANQLAEMGDTRAMDLTVRLANWS